MQWAGVDLNDAAASIRFLAHEPQGAAALPRTAVDPRVPLPSPRAHRLQEFRDLELEPVALLRHRLRRGEDAAGGNAGLAGAAIDVIDVGSHLRGALRSFLHRLGDAPGGRALLDTPVSSY